MRLGPGYNMLRWYPDGSRLVGVGSQRSMNSASVYKPDGTVVGKLELHPTNVCSVAVDNNHIVSGGSNGTCTCAANEIRAGGSACYSS